MYHSIAGAVREVGSDLLDDYVGICEHTDLTRYPAGKASKYLAARNATDLSCVSLYDRFAERDLPVAGHRGFAALLYQEYRCRSYPFWRARGSHKNSIIRL